MMKSKTPVYKVWSSMKKRCRNPNDTAYPNYGGRGIKVCARWDNSFDAFLADMGPRPEVEGVRYSIERLDNDKGYFPDNCVWATSKEQCRNNRSNLPVTFKGETRIFIEWCEEIDFMAELGLTDHAVYCRIMAYGWSAERAFTEPYNSSEVHLVNGENLTIPQIMEKYNLSLGLLRGRLGLGWAGDDLVKPSLVVGTFVLPEYDSVARTCLEWSKIYKCSEATARKWLKAGKLPGVKSNRAPIEFNGQSMTSINWARLWGIDRKDMSRYRKTKGLSMQQIHDIYGPGRLTSGGGAVDVK